MKDDNIELTPNDSETIQLDKVWLKISEITDAITDQILVIPHSNAEEEKLFSLVRRNKGII